MGVRSGHIQAMGRAIGRLERHLTVYYVQWLIGFLRFIEMDEAADKVFRIASGLHSDTGGVIGADLELAVRDVLNEISPKQGGELPEKVGAEDIYMLNRAVEYLLGEEIVPVA